MSSIIFGPIHSRRFGKSLGVDLSPNGKQCNFDCLYCELEPAKTMDAFEDVVSVQEVATAIKEALKTDKNIDYITLTANGEPTLYPHLNVLIDAIDTFKGNTKTLILSNAANIDEPTIQEALLKLDEVKLSLDCVTQACLRKLDRSHKGIEVENIKKGMLAFKKRYTKPLVIEILFVKDLNDSNEEVAKLNEYLLTLQPTRIDIGTIDRPPAYKVEALSYEALLEIANQFSSTLPIYIASRKDSNINQSSYEEEAILQTLARRPLTKEDITLLMDEPSQKRVKKLLDVGSLKTLEANGVTFYKKV